MPRCKTTSGDGEIALIPRY